MKKTLLFIIFITLFVNATNAQWYYRKCGVTDINNCTVEEFECLWSKSNNTVGAGIGMSIIGFGAIVVANGMTSGFLDFTPAILGLTGFILVSVGIPVMITGTVRTGKLKKSVNYDNLNLGSLSLSPTINVNQFNNSQYYGLSISFNF